MDQFYQLPGAWIKILNLSSLVNTKLGRNLFHNQQHIVLSKPHGALDRADRSISTYDSVVLSMHIVHPILLNAAFHTEKKT